MTTATTPPNLGKPAPLPPVRTREDCLDWLNLEDCDRELFAAFHGARQYILKHDFEPDVIDIHSRPGTSDGPGLIPGTVLAQADGQPWVARYSFLEVVVQAFAWRLQALAERRGVDLHHYSPDLVPGPRWASVSELLADQTYLGKYVGGEVETRHFKTKREALAWAKAQQKSAPAAVTCSSRAVTNVDRSNDDGTNCRS